MKKQQIIASAIAAAVATALVVTAATAATAQGDRSHDADPVASSRVAAVVSTTDFDLGILSAPPSKSDLVPESARPADLVQGYQPETTRWVGSSGTTAFWVTVSGEGQVCLIAITGHETKDWYATGSCSSAEQFTAGGAGVRMISPTNAIEAYLIPDSAVDTTSQLKSISQVGANIVMLDPYSAQSDRSQSKADGSPIRLLGEYDASEGR